MQASRVTGARRRFFWLIASGGTFLAASIGGCGSSETATELSPEAKKSVIASKVGDPSKFVKPKSAGGRRR